MNLETSFLPEKILYSGSELRPHWISERLRIYDSAVVAFRGPCQVDTGEMVDQEDRQNSRFITAKEMVHFIGEWFADDLGAAVVRQRLFIAAFADILRARISPENKIERKGNDLFITRSGAARKLSVSIVTASPVSTLFHFGVNIDASGAPVDAIGLSELQVDADEITHATLHAWKEEWRGMWRARCKVMPR